MGWFNRPSKLDILVQGYKEQLSLQQAQIEMLMADVDKKDKQIDKLQEALIAIQSPLAYGEMKYDERTAGSDRSSMTAEQRENNSLREEVTRTWFQNMEGNLWNSPDEMIDSLMNLGGKTPGMETEPLHENEES